METKQKNTRDEKGRFTEGNTEGEKFVAGGAQSETARKGAIACNAAKKQNQKIAEAVRRVLLQQGKEEGKTVMDEIVEKAIENSGKTPDADTILKIQKILGEEVNNVTVSVPVQVANYGDDE